MGNTIQFLEKDLETIIFETPNEKLRNRGLYIYGEKRRQVRIGNYGVADILSIRRDSEWEHDIDVNDKEYLQIFPSLDIQIFELKQNKVDLNAVLQCVRYARGVIRYISNHRDKDFKLNVSLTLIGRDMQSGDFSYLPSIFHKLSIYTYEYSVDGIKFNRELGYKLVDENFPLSNSQMRKQKKELIELPF